MNLFNCMMTHNLKYYLIALLLTFIVSAKNGFNASDIIEVQNSESLLDISSSLQFFEDNSGELTISDIQSKEFTSVTSSVPNFGVSNSTFWVKSIIKNSSDQNNLILELSMPTLDNVEFYLNDGNNNFNVIKSGEELPFYNRKYKDPNYLFDIEIPKGDSKLFYLKVSSSEGIQIPLKIGSKTAIYSQIKSRDVLSGIYVGIMLVMILYNLFIYFSVKDNSYIYYVIYILFVLLTQTVIQGYTYQYLWPSSSWFAKQSMFIFPALVGISGMLFMVVFLRVGRYNAYISKVAIVLSISYVIAVIMALIGFHKISFNIIEATAIMVAFYMLFTAIFIVKKGYPPAKYFLAAWSIFLIGIIIYVLKDFEILPFNNFTRYTMQIGSGLETILLSFALAARINYYKKEKEESQEQKLAVMRVNETIIKNQNIVLEQKVEERTEHLNKTLKDLKQAQSQLVDSEKMSSLGMLTAGIAHEINNPINFVSSNIYPLKQDIKELNSIITKYEELESTEDLSKKLIEIERFKKDLDYEYLQTELSTIINSIEDGAKRTTEIVSGLRNFSRLDEGELKEADINEGIHSTLILIKNKLNGITIKKNLSSIPKIECYPGKLNQLFMNVIDNSISAIHSKEMDNSKGIINISTSSDSEFVYIKISDNGIGIKKEIKNKIFDPFFTMKDVGEGTGLGLSISYGIVEAHKGEIEVNSEDQIGTEFIVKIPLNNK